MRRRFFLLIIAVFVCLPVVHPGDAGATNIFSVRITGYGLYKVTPVLSDEVQDTAGRTGQGVKAAEVHNLLRTERIPGAVGNVFGVEYVVKGVPPGGQASLKAVLEHPRLKNPKSGRSSTRSTWKVSPDIGRVNWTGWTFTSKWEAAPGRWTLALYLDGARVAEQAFEVYGSRLSADSPLNLKVRIPAEARDIAQKNAAKRQEAEQEESPAPSAGTLQAPAETSAETAGTPPSASEFDIGPSKVYLVQVAAFEDPSRARRLVRELDEAGHPATILKLYDQKGKLYQTIFIAAKPTLEQAREAARAYSEASGQDSFVRPLDVDIFEKALAR